MGAGARVTVVVRVGESGAVGEDVGVGLARGEAIGISGRVGDGALVCDAVGSKA